MMISELRRQQNEMAKLLKDKDAEIEHYQMQGAKVTRSEYQPLIFITSNNIIYYFI